MVCIDTGVNDGDTGSSAGIAGRPGDRRADGHGRAGGVRIVRIIRLNGRGDIVLTFKLYALDAGDRPNRIKVAKAHLS